MSLVPITHVALITGEERIMPAHPRFYVCTVEAMPLDLEADFVAIDEIQLGGIESWIRTDREGIFAKLRAEESTALYDAIVFGLFLGGMLYGAGWLYGSLAGFAFLPFSIGIILTAGVVAQLLPRIGPKALMVPGLVLAVVGMLLLTQIDQNTSYWAYVFPAQVLMSVGLAGVFIPASSTSLIGVAHHDAGVASAGPEPRSRSGSSTSSCSP